MQSALEIVKVLCKELLKPALRGLRSVCLCSRRAGVISCCSAVVRGDGRVSTLLAATILLAALSAAAAAPRSEHLTQGLTGTAGVAEKPVAPQRSAAGRRHSPALYQENKHQFRRRRRLAQNTAAASIETQRMVADMQGQQPQQRQPYEDTYSPPAGPAQPPDEQSTQGYNDSGTVRGQAPSPEQQPSQGGDYTAAAQGQTQTPQQQPYQRYSSSGMERGQAQSPQQQLSQGDSYTAAAQGQTQTPQQQPYQGSDTFPAAPVQTQPPQRQPDQGYNSSVAELDQARSPQQAPDDTAVGRRMLSSLD